MSEQRVIYIVIDPSRARSGARAVINSLNGINDATGRVNRQLRASDRAMQGFSRNFSRLQALLITAQPVRFLSGFMRSLIDADKTIMAFKAQLFTVTGDLGRAGEAFEYLKRTAQAYAVPIKSLTKGFSKLKASMNTPELMKYNDALFQSTVVLSSVLHLAEYNTERVFNVMIQIMSKGQLMMEELKQQLGEHVPGAIALAAESMGMSVREMMDRMQSGLVSAEEFAAGWSKLILERFGPAVEVATKSITAAINRFNNVITASMIDLTQNEAGFAIAKMITSIVEKISGAGQYFEKFGLQIAEVALDISDFVEALKPSDIEDFFDSVVNLFKAIIDMGAAIASGILFLSKYKDEVSTIAKVVTLAWGATKLWTASIWAFNVAITHASFRVAALAGAFSLLTGAAALALAGLIGYSIGSWLYDEYDVVKQAGNRIAMAFTWLAEKSTYIFDVMGERMKFAFSDPLGFIMSMINDLLIFMNEIGQGAADFLGFDIDVSKLPIGLLSKYIDENFEDIDDKLATLKTAHEEKLGSIISIYDELYEAIGGDGGDEPDKKDILARLGLPEDFQERMAAMREELQRFKDLEDAYFASGEGGADSGAADKLIGDEASLRQSLETRREAIVRSYFETADEIYRISEATDMSERDRRDLSLRNYKDYTDKMVELNQSQLDEKGEAEKTYWQQYLENMEKALTTGEDLSVDMLSKFTSGIGDAVEDMVFEFTSFEDAFKSLMESMVRSLVNALGQMAAQWIAFQIVKSLADKTTAESSAIAQTQQALATQQQAGLAAFASTAAIPVVGPAAAPAAAGTAIAFTSPMVASIAALSTAAAGARAMGGQVQSGESYLVGERGPEMFTAGGTGHVTPNHQMASGSTSVTQVFQMGDGTNARREAKQVVIEAAPFIKQVAKQAILEAAQSGGAMSRALGRRS